MKRQTKFNRYSKHRQSMLITMCKQLIEHDQIETTITKAKNVQSQFEKLITKAKKSHTKLATTRLLTSRLHNDERAALKLINDIATRFTNRNGGYTRIIPTGFRKGDKAKKGILQILKA